MYIHKYLSPANDSCSTKLRTKKTHFINETFETFCYTCSCLLSCVLEKIFPQQVLKRKNVFINCKAVQTINA